MKALARLVPDGMAGRLALLLTLALLAANAVALALLSVERDRLGREAAVERAIERIVDAVPLIETLPPHGRERVLRRADGRLVNARVEGRARVGPGVPPDARARDVAARVGAALDGREVRAALLDGAADRGRNAGERSGRERNARGPNVRERNGQRLVLSIALAGGDWLNVTLRAPPGRSRVSGPAAILLVLGLSLAAVLAAALLYVRRLVHPLRALAAAARAAGRGDRTARVPETGARELREAAGAFNDMQARIARFDAERTRTLAAVGHDLRTPITSLRIRAEMLDDDAREPMVRTLDEMRVMADGLLAYARGEGDGEASERIDLAPFLARLCDERGAVFAGMEPDTGMRDKRGTVDARPVALGRAIGNLIDNALRYAGSARVTLRMTVAREGASASIAVEDDGPGIAPGRIEAMMEPFARGEASRSVDTGGAGLGLSIARAILRSHGGTLELANRATGGLRAVATLPVVEAG